MIKKYLFILIFGFTCCSTWDNEEPYQPPPELTINETTVSEFPPLPYIDIDTYSVPIVDEPKIKGFLEIYQGEEKLEEHNIGI